MATFLAIDEDRNPLIFNLVLRIAQSYYLDFLLRKKDTVFLLI